MSTPQIKNSALAARHLDYTKFVYWGQGFWKEQNQGGKKMARYYVNTNAQENGDHEVHKEGCYWLPMPHNLIYLGNFSTCFPRSQESARVLQAS